MSNWEKFKISINKLVSSNMTANQRLKEWDRIKKEYSNLTPLHLVSFLNFLEKSNKNIKILDHGCGNGLTIIFLLMKGYKNVWGIDISTTNAFNKRKNQLNKLLNAINAKSENKIFNYNGKKIPFKKEHFDLIFSQQVIEHVDDKFLDYYLSEEKRVLRSQGFIFHQIPHRLGPYEGHTKRWVIHWFPKNIHRFFLRKNKNNLNLVNNSLFLRWPWHLKKKFNQYFHDVSNITRYRLVYDVESKEFTKTENFIRKKLVRLFRLPLLGSFFVKVIVCFFQLEIIAYKR